MAVNQTAREALYLYMFNVVELNPEEFRATVQAAPLTGEQTKSIMSLADYLKQEGREEGREEGQEEGCLFGQVQALQQALGQLVEARATLKLKSKEQLEIMVGSLQRELHERLK